MPSSASTIIDPTRSGNRDQFLFALKASLNDLYNKGTDTNIHRLYATLAEQLKDVDINISRVFADLFLTLPIKNEPLKRGYNNLDVLSQEGAYQLTYIGFVPEGTRYYQNNELSPIDNSVILDIIPKPDTFTVTFNGVDVSSSITSYDAEKNTITLSTPEIGTYFISYEDAGVTRAIRETIPLTLSTSGRRQGQLTSKNILYNSEKIYIANSGIGTLIRDKDYSLNQATGEIVSIEGGLIEVLEANELETSYYYNFDFSKLTSTSFHKQFYNEPVILTTNGVQVQNSNVSEVFRLFNETNQEVYTPTSISRGVINYQGSTVPTIKTLSNFSLTQKSFELKLNVLVNTFTLDITTNRDIGSLQQVNSITAVSYPIRLIEGKREVVQPRYTLPVPYEYTKISIQTGSLSFYRSNIFLIETIDYDIVEEIPGIASILLYQGGFQKIGTNSVYVVITTKISPYNLLTNYVRSNFTVQANTTIPSSTYPIINRTIFLDTKPYITVGSTGDIKIAQQLIIQSLDSLTTYIEGEDYTYDPFTQTISLTSSSSIDTTKEVLIFFGGLWNYTSDISYSPNYIVCDYDTTDNAIDWGPSLTSYTITLTKNLTSEDNQVTLYYHPSDMVNFFGTKIYLKSDPSQLLKIQGYNTTDRILTFQAPNIDGEYIVEYTGFKHQISPETSYYVSYNYGARDNALRNAWSPLLNIKETSRRRVETVSLLGNQTTAHLSYAPVNINNIVVYLEGQTENESQATIVGFNPVTYTLTFSPIRAAGNYNIAYDTLNASTEDLRTLCIGLMQAYLAGPTKVAIEDLIRLFTGLTPLIQPATALAFRIADQSVTNPATRSQNLSEVPPISIGTNFVPAKFNAGLLTTSAAQTRVAVPAITNIGTLEGTIQFLLGPKFNGDDNISHYFIDVGASKRYYQNRISIYKNEANYLVFELFDNDKKLWRVASPVGRQVKDHFVYLEKGQTQTQLPTRPTFSSTDINNDNREDLLLAHKTELTIDKVFTDTKYEGYGYTPSVPVNQQYKAPVRIAFLVQIQDKPQYSDLTQYENLVRSILALSRLIENVNGKMILHVSPTFIQMDTQHVKLIESLKGKVEVGFYASIPTTIVDPQQRVSYLQTALNLFPEFPVSTSIDSNFHDWPSLLAPLGLNIITGNIDSRYGSSFLNPTPFIHRVTDLIAETGNNVYTYVLALFLNKSLPISSYTTQQFESSLYRSISQNQINQVATWYLSLDIEDITSNYTNEMSILDSWIRESVNPLISLNKVIWGLTSESLQIFNSLEAWTTNLTGTLFNQIPQSVIRPIKYNWDTKVLSFDSIPESGVYRIQYVTGWAAYEESEIFISAVYKLHSQDGTLPFYRLYINGEMINYLTFADLPSSQE